MEFCDIKPFARFVRTMKIDENADFPPYYPLDARLFYVIAGEGRIALDGRPMAMPPGSVLNINAGKQYHLLPCCATSLAVNFDFSSAHASLTTPIPPVNARLSAKVQPVERHAFADAPCFDTYCFFSDCHALQIKLIALEKEYARKLPFAAQECTYLLASVLTAIARRAEQRASKETRFDIEEIVKYIHGHLDGPLDNHLLGRQFQFHPNYISAEFKRCTGKPLHQYVLETRIISAAALMEAGNSDIGDIARQTGFSDHNYFSRYFKRVMGISPGKYIRTCVEKGK